MDNHRLYELREYHDMTQQMVADILGVKQQTYFDWEKNNKIIPLKHLVNLCKYYKVSLDYISGLSKDKGYMDDDFILDNKLIGSRLKELRSNLGIYQKDIANLLNTTPSTICAYEAGKTTILTIFAYQICKHYKVSFDWLVGVR